MKSYLEKFYLLFPITLFAFYAVYLFPISSWSDIEFLYYIFPRGLYVGFLLSLILIGLFFILAVKYFRTKPIKVFFILFIFPFLLEISLGAYMSLVPLDNTFFVYFILFLNSYLLYFYFKHVFLFLVDEEKDKSFLINLMSLGGFILIYFTGATIYGLQSVLNVPVLILMLYLSLVFIMVIYQIFWVNGIAMSSAIFYILIIYLILLEITWSLSFLPLNYNSLGLIISVSFYMIVGISRHSILGTLDKKTVRLYLNFGFLSILAILLSSRWV